MSGWLFQPLFPAPVWASGFYSFQYWFNPVNLFYWAYLQSDSSNKLLNKCFLNKHTQYSWSSFWMLMSWSWLTVVIGNTTHPQASYGRNVVIEPNTQHKQTTCKQFKRSWWYWRQVLIPNSLSKHISHGTRTLWSCSPAWHLGCCFQGGQTDIVLSNFPALKLGMQDMPRWYFKDGLQHRRKAPPESMTDPRNLEHL